MTSWQSQLSLTGTGPVYDQIKTALLDLIQTGTWPPGHRIPGEEDLARHFDTARMTVNRALKELAEAGWIERRRRAGSFVAQPAAPTALLEITDMAKAIPARGQAYAYACRIAQPVRADERLARAFNAAPGHPLLHIQALHRADDVVVELEERWINLALLPAAREADFHTTPPGGWLLNAAPWTEAEHTISAINAAPDQAGLLEMSPGGACLLLERRTFQGDDVVTYARLTHPGDRHRMTERFMPG